MLIDDIRKIVKGEVANDEATLKKFSNDASVFNVTPKLVVRPRDAEDIKNLVRFAAKQKKSMPELSLTARSAGTDMTGGPLTESVVVDFLTHINKFKGIQKTEDGGIAEVEPGMFYRDFEKETLKEGLLMPSYPASRELCSVGGMVSNNSGGEKTLSYGKTEDYVEELRVILSDGEEHIIKPLSSVELKKKIKEKSFEGEIYRKLFELVENNYDLIHNAKPNVSKNSAGYYLWNVWDRKTFNLHKLIVGSQGTLGFVTDIKFRLVKTKSSSELLVIFLKDLNILGELVDTISPYHPEAFESYDDKTFKLAVRFFPQLLRRMKGGLFKLGIQFIPEIWLTLTGGVPNLVLMVEFTGNSEEEVKSKMREVDAVIRAKFKVKTHMTKNRDEESKYWVMRRESFSLLREHIHGKHTAPFIDDIVVRPHDLPQFLPRLNALLDPYKKQIIYTIAGHAGDGNFHIIPLMDFKNPKQREIILELSNKVYSLVAEFKGSITGEHNDGLIRTPYLNKMYSPEMLDLFKKTKEIFDPLNIFNPGKKVNGDLDYAIRHVRSD